MKVTLPIKVVNRWSLFFGWVLLLSFTGCVSTGPRKTSNLGNLGQQLARAERRESDTPQGLGAFLTIAEAASDRIINGPRDTQTANSSLLIFNRATADFCESWLDQHRPAEVRDERSGEKFRVASPEKKIGAWVPGYFQALRNAQTINHKFFTQSVEQAGIGGALVGIRHSAPDDSPSPRLEPPKGFRMPVTAILQFKRDTGKVETDVDVELLNPRYQNQVLIGSRRYPLEEDFTAPLASYHRVNATWAGFINMVRGGKTEGRSGLYMLEPYDPNRTPVILVHGLLSSGYTWLNVGNSIQTNPEIRKRYQFWVFFYPTGNPILYSALRLREDLAFAQQRYGLKQGIILIGHSMGGIISRLQVTDLDPAIYKRVFGQKAEVLLSILASNQYLRSAFIFKANSLVKRVIFISTPHRGSAIASSALGALGERLIRLPILVSQRVPKSLLLARRAYERKRGMPTSIDGLSPKSLLFRLTDQRPVLVPHNSIIGDRGRGDTPNSSDGVVPYWSSHLATASSELIVPTGHGALNSPLAIAEMQRILLLTAGLRPNLNQAEISWAHDELAH